MSEQWSLNTSTLSMYWHINISKKQVRKWRIEKNVVEKRRREKMSTYQNPSFFSPHPPHHDFYAWQVLSLAERSFSSLHSMESRSSFENVENFQNLEKIWISFQEKLKLPTVQFFSIYIVGLCVSLLDGTFVLSSLHSMDSMVALREYQQNEKKIKKKVG